MATSAGWLHVTAPIWKISSYLRTYTAEAHMWFCCISNSCRQREWACCYSHKFSLSHHSHLSGTCIFTFSCRGLICKMSCDSNTILYDCLKDKDNIMLSFTSWVMIFPHWSVIILLYSYSFVNHERTIKRTMPLMSAQYLNFFISDCTPRRNRAYFRKFS